MSARTSKSLGRTSITRKGTPTKSAPRTAHKDLPDYVVEYPVPGAVPFKPFPIKVPAGYAATVVLVPARRNSEKQIEFRIDLYVSGEARTVSYTATGLGVVLVHVLEGHSASPQAIEDHIQTKVQEAIRGGDPVIVRGNPP